MKVKIVVELDIPDIDDFSTGEINQLVFDAYTNYATCKHFEDSIWWCAKSRLGTSDEDKVARSIYEYHQLWGDICSVAKVNYEIQGEGNSLSLLPD